MNNKSEAWGQAFPWHKEVFTQIVQRYQSGRLPHALLFSGDAGVGKQQLAYSIAAFLLCRNAEHHACGQCSGCELLKAGTHPDLLQILPESEGKQIKIEQIRSVQSNIGKTAQQGGYRVVIVQPADGMNANAANALLKNLEEPGENVLFILISSRLSALLPTVKSRCQHTPLPLPDQEQAKVWLQHQLDSHAAQHADSLLRMANGNPLTAVLLASEALHKQREQLYLNLESLTRGAEPIELAAAFLQGDLHWTLRWLQAWLADWSSWVLLQQDEQVKYPEMLPLYRHWQKTAHLNQARSLFLSIGELRQQLASGANPNTQLAVESLLIRWADKMLG